MKGIVLRHLRWWQQQSIVDRDRILTTGLRIRTGDVRGLQLPGSPYWALKTYLIRRCRKHTRSGRRKNNRCPRLMKNM